MILYLTAPMDMTEDDMISLRRLSALGWKIEVEHSREAISAFRDRMGISHKTLLAILRHPRCPHAETEHSSGGQRLVAIYSTPALESFIRSFRQG